MIKKRWFDDAWKANRRRALAQADLKLTEPVDVVKSPYEGSWPTAIGADTRSLHCECEFLLTLTLTLPIVIVLFFNITA